MMRALMAVAGMSLLGLQGGRAVPIPAEQFRAQWTAGGAAMAQKYADSTVQVKGTVAGATVDLMNRRALVVKLGEELKTVHVSVVTKTPEPWGVVGLGQAITVQGQLNGSTFVPYLLDAQLVKPGANTSVTVTAQDLAAEAGRDRKAAAAKYKGKSLIVTGVVASHDAKRQEVVLKGDAAGSIECRFVPMPKGDNAAGYTEGKEARIYGVVSPFQNDTGPFALRECMPLSATAKK